MGSAWDEASVWNKILRVGDPDQYPISEATSIFEEGNNIASQLRDFTATPLQLSGYTEARSKSLTFTHNSHPHLDHVAYLSRIFLFAKHRPRKHKGGKVGQKGELKCDYCRSFKKTKVVPTNLLFT
jgi:hypothetical protein